MQDLGRKSSLAIIMVGIPARGKTFYARKISRFLNWLGYCSKVFNPETYSQESSLKKFKFEFTEHNQIEVGKLSAAE